jgi:DNA-binding transcriptional ArsR family regulator
MRGEASTARSARPSQIDRTFAALADRHRRGAIDLLRRRPRTAGELARGLALSAPAMSRHLRVLRQAGLVEEELGDADARVRVYRLRKQPFSSLRSWAEEIEAFWGEQLLAFKEHAERHHRSRS